MLKKVRTRFAPSPTGPLHMGGVRTALYAYLFAKKNNGDFILRIEDTDQNRYVPGAEEYIIEALKWCGIIPDEGVGFGGTHAPYRQSERKHSGVYQHYAEQLIKNGNAYYAFDSTDELDAKRKEAENNHVSFLYNAQSRMQMKNSLTMTDNEVKKLLEKKTNCVIRLKIPENETVSFTDLVRGEVSFQSLQIDDKVLIKADGMPTYHLAHIVDDIEMEITHAIRGEEWLPSAPAHIYIYKFLGKEHEMPQYAHLPLLLKPEGNGKLSKRDGDRLGFPVFPLQWTDPDTKEISSGYREKGYYAAAFINILALLGWNDGTEKEIFSMQELIGSFSFDRVHKSGAKFDPEKAKWINQQYLHLQSDAEIADRFRQVVSKKINAGMNDLRLSAIYIKRSVQLLKEKIQFENELWEKGSYLFVPPTSYDEGVLVKKWTAQSSDFFTVVHDAFLRCEDWRLPVLENIFKGVALQKSINPGGMMQLFRVLVTGLSGGVALFEMVELLGKEEVCSRIKNALSAIKYA